MPDNDPMSHSWLYKLAAIDSGDKLGTDEILIFPDGNVEALGLPDVVMNIEAAARIIAAFNDRGNDIPIDIEHSTHYKAARGELSPAVGWINRLRFEKGVGLIGHVEWTPEARELIKARQVKYLSPHFKIDPETREVAFILAVALTNTPKINNQPELVAAAVAADTLEREIAMSKKKTKDTAATATLSIVGPRDRLQRIGKTFLGAEVLPDVEVDVEALPEEQAVELDEVGQALEALKTAMVDAGTATEDASSLDIIQMAIDAVGGAGEPAEEAASLCASLGLKNGASHKDILASVDKLRATTVSGDEYKKVTDRVATLEATEADRKADLLVASLVDTGKLLPTDTGKMKWAHEQARKDPGNFAELMASAPQVWQPGRVVDPTVPPKDRAAKCTVEELKKLGGKPTRKELIASAVHEFGAEDFSIPSGVGVKSWVNSTLDQEHETLLSITEVETLTKN